MWQRVRIHWEIKLLRYYEADPSKSWQVPLRQGPIAQASEGPCTYVTADGPMWDYRYQLAWKQVHLEPGVIKKDNDLGYSTSTAHWTANRWFFLFQAHIVSAVGLDPLLESINYYSPCFHISKRG